MVKIELGVERLLAAPDQFVKGQRVGLICNQSSVDHEYNYSVDRFFSDPIIDLRAVFGPQHGIRGDVQDNMVETAHGVDQKTGLPVYSLYSDTRKPTAEMLADIDVLAFDLQDIGGRVYTFIYTMAYAMQACAEFKKKFIVLDRPNPIGGEVEGNLLEAGHESFVGQYPIPMRHGMTSGELAKLFNKEFDINCDLEVVEMGGWNRSLYLDETDSPWVMPSPNMPTVETAVVFPGTVYLEGTEVSEGRGTTRPFEIVGAPYVDPELFSEHLNSMGLSGVFFRAMSFVPTFQKSSGVSCGGVFVHVTDRSEFKPVITGVAIVKSLFDLYPDDFEWKRDPYEYEFERNAFDVIAGGTRLREMMESGASILEISRSWEKDEESFKDLRSGYLLYG